MHSCGAEQRNGKNFKKKSNIGDTIYLYANKVGIIAKGKYNGNIYEPSDIDKAPDWSDLEKQLYIEVEEWIIFENPINYKARPQTLYYEKREIEWIFNYFFVLNFKRIYIRNNVNIIIDTL